MDMKSRAFLVEVYISTSLENSLPHLTKTKYKPGFYTLSIYSGKTMQIFIKVYVWNVQSGIFPHSVKPKTTYMAINKHINCRTLNNLQSESD